MNLVIQNELSGNRNASESLPYCMFLTYCLLISQVIY